MNLKVPEKNADFLSGLWGPTIVTPKVEYTLIDIGYALQPILKALDSLGNWLSQKKWQPSNFSKSRRNFLTSFNYGIENSGDIRCLLFY